MEPAPDPSPRRKMRFVPKAPRRRNPTPATTKPTKDDAAEDDHEDIPTRQTRRAPDVEKKPSEEVLISHGVASNDDRSERANSSRQTEKNDDQMQPCTSESTVGTGIGEGLCNSTYAVTEKKEKEYQEPWDYNSYYPVTLPLRRPYSGNPELLNKQEFEEAPKYNEADDLPAATELGLVDEVDEPRMLFFEFPSELPFGTATRRDTYDDSKAPQKWLINQKGKGKAVMDSSVSGAKKCSLEELPQGSLGKMLVYKSGAVKLKVGEILFDVNAGIKSNCPEGVMAINTVNGDCCELGEVTKKAMVLPDFDQLGASD